MKFRAHTLLAALAVLCSATHASRSGKAALKLAKAGKLDDAIRAFDEALDADPGTAKILTNFAATLMLRAQTAEEAGQLTAALALVNEAQSKLHQALALKPSHRVASKNLEDCQEIAERLRRQAGADCPAGSVADKSGHCNKAGKGLTDDGAAPSLVKIERIGSGGTSGIGTLDAPCVDIGGGGGNGGEDDGSGRRLFAVPDGGCRRVRRPPALEIPKALRRKAKKEAKRKMKNKSKNKKGKGSSDDSRPRVLDAFLFNDELDLLELRLAEHDDFVDIFMIIESTVDHAGNDKRLYAREAVASEARFERWRDRIVLVTLDEDVVGPRRPAAPARAVQRRPRRPHAAV